MRLYSTDNLKKISIDDLQYKRPGFFELLEEYGFGFDGDHIIFDIDYANEYNEYKGNTLNDLRKKILRDETIDLLMK